MRVTYDSLMCFNSFIQRRTLSNEINTINAENILLKIFKSCFVRPDIFQNCCCPQYRMIVNKITENWMDLRRINILYTVSHDDVHLLLIFIIRLYRELAYEMMTGQIKVLTTTNNDWYHDVVAKDLQVWDVWGLLYEILSVCGLELHLAMTAY